MKNIKYILLLVPVLISFIQDNQPLAELNKVYSKYLKISEPGYSGKYYMKYKVTSYFADSLKINPITEYAETYFENNRFAFLSENTKVFFDSKQGIIVSEDEKQVFIYYPQSNDQVKVRSNNNTLFQNELLNDANLITTKQEILNKKSIKKIRVRVSEKIRKKTGINIVDYYIEKGQYLAGIRTYYSKSPLGFKTIDFYIINQSFNPDASILKKDFYSMVFNTDGSLLPKYKGYKVTDYRKKNK